MQTRITELPNRLTENIDAASPEEILEMLQQCDEQMFEGWECYPHVASDCHVKTLATTASVAAEMLENNIKNDSKNAFVFSGCGTSGRIAWLCARTFNQCLDKFSICPCFHYLIAGGDPSLIRGQELPEDNPIQGVQDLQQFVEGNDSVMYFGITCGLSAPYIAGQIDYAMKQEAITPVLIGFNPVSLARDIPIENWQKKTCRQVFLCLENEVMHNRGFILNPIVGPESIAGSTRMKGGSMTKILLETIFLTALNQVIISCPCPSAGRVSLSTTDDTTEQTPEMTKNMSDCLSTNGAESTVLVRSLLDLYHRAAQAAYSSDKRNLSVVLNCAGESLRKPQGHVYYLGSESFGLIGLVDGSEMLATFGASLDDVRGFVEGGWSTCKNQNGDISSKGRVFRISTDHFKADILPHLTSDDLVIFLGPEISSSCLLDRLSMSHAQLACISIAEFDGHSHRPMISESRYCVNPVLKPPQWTGTSSFALANDAEMLATELSVKIAVNAISTGANTLTGRVYKNAMINVTVANNKLFHRSINIISQLSQRPVEACRAALLSAIYSTNIALDKVDKKPISEHILMAVKVKMAVPTAILIASGKAKTVSEAQRMLQSVTSIRLLVQQI